MLLDCVYPEWQFGSLILTVENAHVYILLSLSIKFPGTQRQILNSLTKQTQTMFCPKNFRVIQEIIKSREKQQQNMHITHVEYYRTTFSSLHPTDG